jgi:hypothetical protein
MNPSPLDILLLSNGPGEISTWVRPMVGALRQQFGQDSQQVRISLVLAPDGNASGQEAETARGYPGLDRVQAAADFLPFLLSGKTRDNWDWHPRGVVVFLGGDQFFTVVIGKRLGYRMVSYIEWEARWSRWVDALGVVRPQILAALPSQFASKATVVGDLMVDSVTHTQSLPLPPELLGPLPEGIQPELIGLLPGSKPLKLSLGVPLLLATAHQIHCQRPQTRFVIPVAPTVSLQALASFADPKQRSQLAREATAQLVEPTTGLPYLETGSGLKIYLWTPVPAYDLLRQCQLCLTTVGANTAELTALGVPMLVLLPFQRQDAMRAWDGIPGLLANLPLVGRFWTVLILWLVIQKGLGWRSWLQIWAGGEINWQLVKQGLGPRAWPNLWANREIVPELVGVLTPEGIAAQALELLTHPQQLSQMQQNLEAVRGETGAAFKLAQLIQQVL